MAIEFVWDEKYSVNDEEIDQQHKSLFAMGNEIHFASLKEKKGLVLQLYKYTLEHFDKEEEHMKKMDFPLLREHTALHGDLISTLNDITADGLQTKREADAFEKFVYRWLSRHIQTEDRKYADFTKTSK